MSRKVAITCKCGCGRTKRVRQADINRGWGLFYSKTCKAEYQERQTGQFKDWKETQEYMRKNYPHKY